MQNNVNAENVLLKIVGAFGSDNVEKLLNGDVKLMVHSLGNNDILNISNMLQYADVQIKRSNKKIVVFFCIR